MPKPLIGITTFHMSGRLNDPHEFLVLRPRYVQAIHQAGGVAALIPLGQSEEDLRTLFDRLDGVLLSGGGDVAPARFGKETIPEVSEVDDIRDEVEFNLARWAIGDKKPVLAICRGSQVLNVALGGTLILDIPTQFNNALTHNIVPDNSPVVLPTHPVRLEPDSRLAALMGQTEVTVNSMHHQSVEEIAPALRVVGHAPDGVIEAVELKNPEHPFAIGVQWHPEWLTERPETRRLFSAFVEACTP